MRIIFFILITVTLIGNSCRKNPQAQYYFRCKIGGQNYVPDNCANCLTCTILGDTTFLLGANNGFQVLTIGIIEKNGFTEKKYILNQVLSSRGTYKNSTLTNDRYYTDSLRTGYLLINALDKSNNTISAQFNFNAFNSYRNDSINANGEFRLKYTTY